MTRGAAARLALVEQAERLFADRGIEAVSLRDVSAAAGQRNHSAAQYHFGDREGLVAAVYEHRMRVVNQQRHALIDSLDLEGRNDVTAMVEAAVLPLIDVVAASGGWYARFLARTRWDSFAWRVLADMPTVSSYVVVVTRLHRLLDGVPLPIRRARLEQMLTLVVGTVAGWEWAHERGAERLPRDVLAADLVVTCVALLTAPVATIATSHPELTGASR